MRWDRENPKMNSCFKIDFNAQCKTVWIVKVYAELSHNFLFYDYRSVPKNCNAIIKQIIQSIELECTVWQRVNEKKHDWSEI